MYKIQVLYTEILQKGPFCLGNEGKQSLELIACINKRKYI